MDERKAGVEVPLRLGQDAVGAGVAGGEDDEEILVVVREVVCLLHVNAMGIARLDDCKE